MRKIVNYLVLALGWIFVLIGAIGVFVPLLPTTPFLLLAAACFSYASPKLKHWLHSHPKFGKVLTDWEREKVIPLYAKTIATIMMLSMISYPIFFKPLSLSVKTIVLISVVLVLLYIWSKPSKPKTSNTITEEQKLDSQINK